MKRLEAGHIDLDPDFQRSRGIWTTEKKGLLIESLLLRIPLPTFYVAELEGAEDLGESSWAVVDGIQRLSAIAEFVAPSVFELPPLRLRGLEYLSDEDGKSFRELSKSLQLRILESQFTIQVIRKTTPETVKLNIFARINTGGVPLSAQELRHALIPGQARSILRDMAKSKEFRLAVASSVSPSRMVDREMALRYIAFRITNPETYQSQDFDSFLREMMRQINTWSPDTIGQTFNEFSLVMASARDIFGDDAFRKRYAVQDARRPVSKALFEAVAVSLAQIRDEHGDEGLRTLSLEREEVKRGFVGLMHDSRFERAISQGTGDPGRVRVRFGRLRELMESVATRSLRD